MNRFIVGGLVILVGMVIGFTSAFATVLGGQFTDIYLGDEYDSWSEIGTHDNTITEANGYLTLDDTAETGVFSSDIIEPNGNFDIERIAYTSSDIFSEQNQQMDITVTGYRDGVAQESEVIEVRESGTRSVSVGTLVEGNYDGYQFDVDMETETNNNPTLEEFIIQGDEYEEEGMLSTVLMIFLIFSGVLMMV